MMPVGDIVELIRARGINVIYGQKSFIRLIADHFGAHNIPPPKLELLIPGAEKVSESDRRFFGEVFRPTRYCEFYGTTETNLIGAKYDDDYEIDYKAVFFSLRDAVSDGGVTSGSIIVSSLVNEAQPILNVEIGDRVSVRNYDELYLLRATINKIDGRENDYLRLPNGDKISGATFYATLEYFPFMRQFRIVQESLDSCTILLRVTEPSEENRGKVDRAVGDLLRGKIRYNVKYVDDIPIDPNGKTKILSSRIACRADEWP
jgi:phenylacetate-coenzyme A ligase PaaK-like adenylate-forming protein